MSSPNQSPNTNFAIDVSKVLTDEQVQRALRADQGSKARLSSWAVVDFTEKGDNYATMVTSLSVVYVLEGEENTTSYVVKINPKMGFIDSLNGLTRIFFDKETEFYCKILPAMNDELRRLDLTPLNFPKCHYSDLESDNEVIFMEDLRDKGFQMYDRKKGLDSIHTTLIVKALARLHAASLLLQARTPDTDLVDRFPFLRKDWHNTSEDDDVDILGKMCKPGLDMAEAVLQRYKSHGGGDPWVAEVKDRVTEFFISVIKREAPFEVICHGDCWNNNVLFRYNDAGQPVEVMLVDLQLARVSSPVSDLAYLFLTSLDGPVRKDHTGAFLNAYHDALVSVLGAAGRPAPFTLPQLRQEYERKQDYGLLFACMSIIAILSSSEELPDLGSLKQEDIPLLQQNYKKMNLEKMDRDLAMRSRYLSLFDRFKDE